MEWIERLNGAINYIEEHIEEEINMEQVARIACCSSYHFQRMFTYMAGLPLTEYIRRRRMSLAAVDLQDGNNKVLDVALKYRYESPTAFNRAFKNIHGIAPSQIREEGVTIKAFPPLTFKISIKGDCEMNYRIIKKEAFRIIGITMPLDQDVEQNFQKVPVMWGKASTDGTIGKLAGLINGTPQGILGVSQCNEPTDWKYYIGVANDCEETYGFEEYIVPEATWAVFYEEGENIHIQDLERRIVTEWLPTSGYEYGAAPDIEIYYNADPLNAKYEVWVPVVRKEK